METTRRALLASGLIVLNERQWLGLGRRWKGGKQTPPELAPVVVCGTDESDGNYSNVAWMQRTSAPANFVLFQFICAVDAFVERLMVLTSGATPEVEFLHGLNTANLAAITPNVPPAGVARPCSVQLFEADVTVGFGATCTRIPTGQWVELGGMSIPPGYALTLCSRDSAVTLTAYFVFREAVE